VLFWLPDMNCVSELVTSVTQTHTRTQIYLYSHNHSD